MLNGFAITTTLTGAYQPYIFKWHNTQFLYHYFYKLFLCIQKKILNFE